MQNTEIITQGSELLGCPTLDSSRVNLGKTCGLEFGALAELGYPLCDTCQEHKRKTLGVKLGVRVQLS